MLSQTMEPQFLGWSYNRPVPELADGGGSLKDPLFDSIQGDVSTHSNTSLVAKHDGTVATDIVASVTDEETMGNNIERKIETNTSEKDSTLAEDHNGSSPLPGKDATAERPLLTDEANFLLPSEAPPAAVEEAMDGRQYGKRQLKHSTSTIASQAQHNRPILEFHTP
jgi:hypothetical protein